MDQQYDPIKHSVVGGVQTPPSGDTVVSPAEPGRFVQDDTTVTVTGADGTVYQVPRSIIEAQTAAPQDQPTPPVPDTSTTEDRPAYETASTETAVLDAAEIEGSTLKIYATAPRTGHRFVYTLSSGERADGQ